MSTDKPICVFTKSKAESGGLGFIRTNTIRVMKNNLVVEGLSLRGRLGKFGKPMWVLILILLVLFCVVIALSIPILAGVLFLQRPVEPHESTPVTTIGFVVGVAVAISVYEGIKKFLIETLGGEKTIIIMNEEIVKRERWGGSYDDTYMRLRVRSRDYGEGWIRVMNFKQPFEDHIDDIL